VGDGRSRTEQDMAAERCVLCDRSQTKPRPLADVCTTTDPWVMQPSSDPSHGTSKPRCTTIEANSKVLQQHPNSIQQFSMRISRGLSAACADLNRPPNLPVDTVETDRQQADNLSAM
jgi:hypothetical protein